MGNEEVENGIDVVNEVMLEQENLVKADEMDTDENNPSLKEGVVTNEGEEEFQDVTDEETDGNQGPVQEQDYFQARRGYEAWRWYEARSGAGAPFMVLLWNKVGGSGSWVSYLQCFWLNQLKENHVKGYAGGVQGRWKHRELFVFGIKLEVAEYKHYIFLWSAWDDTSGSMTSLSQSIWYVYWTVESNTRGEGDDLISSMSRSWQARQ
ncbi:hypothetical protein F2Q69_00059379 [Brassica cretica]|uniref:Uncharacterized protein n=1 Tax=Brassica cretica TaxID=69181 RepID=A0A8S9RG37_BRACR|nr:hypothetical protein F2Q69_00059379 [Brassica cretica]